MNKATIKNKIARLNNELDKTNKRNATKGREEIAKLYKHGNALAEELRAVQQQITALRARTHYEHADFCALKKRELEIKVAFCDINIKLAEVSNKYEQYCEFFEEEIK